MRNKKFEAIIYVLVAICTLLSLIPSFFGFLLAFQKEANIPHMFDGPGEFFAGLTFENFAKITERAPYLLTWIKNSFIVSILNAERSTEAVSSMAALFLYTV